MLDLKDKKILFELGQNSRTINKDLAKKVGLSESSTINRIKNLEKQGVLLGTQAIIDNSKLGYQGFRIYITFASTTSEEETKIIEWLKQQKAVTVLARCSGSVDIAIISWVKNKIIFEDFVNLLKEKYREKIGNMEIFIYCETYHFSRNYLLNKTKSKQIIRIGNNSLEKYDEFDQRLLESVYANAKKNVLDISDELKKPPRTVAYRLKQLEKKKIIAGYTITIDTNLIGYEYYKINVILSKNVENKSLIDFATQCKNSVYLDKTIGKYDFELNVEVKDKSELNEIIGQIKDKFGGIKELSMFQVEKFYKINYI